MPSIGAPELILFLVIILLLFGGAKLPKLARSLGQAKNEFEQGVKEGEREGQKEVPAKKADGSATD